MLLNSVRGQNKGPGNYRRVTNWIGRQGSTIATARFVPPPPDRVGELMAAWERYAHAQPEDRLVQIAVLHAEFEAIHPFADGNGRLGRMIVPLHLWQTKQISKPMFYVSGYLEAHRDAYYDRLLGVSRDGDWTGWCEFFLDALRAQAEANLKKTRAILALHASMSEQLADLTRSQHASRALAWMFAKPVFRSSDFVKSAKIPTPTAHRFLAVLREAAVLKTVKPARGTQAAVFAFPALVNIVEGRKVF
ncbi:MAG: Fic family protein [Verrucomicrobia bacterium]|nr:Fic family protein [Verrucomicrobiota bacterium]